MSDESLYPAAIRAAEKLHHDRLDTPSVRVLTDAFHAAIDGHLKSAERQCGMCSGHYAPGKHSDYCVPCRQKMARALIQDHLKSEGWEELREAAERMQREYYENEGKYSQNAMERIDTALLRVRRDDG